MNYFDNDCIICLEKLDKNIVVLSCKHRYHYDCIKAWMEKIKDDKKICPICSNKDTEIVNIEKYEPKIGNISENENPLQNYICCSIL